MKEFFSAHFIANPITNPSEDSSQLSIKVCYVSVALNNLTILELGSKNSSYASITGVKNVKIVLL